MANSWIEHIRKYAKDNNLSYGCALSSPDCKNTYNKPLSKSKKKTDCKSDCTTCKTCNLNKEPHKMYDKPIGPKKPIVPYQSSDRRIGPVQNRKYPINTVKLNPDTITGLETGYAGKSNSAIYYKNMIKQAHFTHGKKVADKLDKFLHENYKHDFDNFYYVANKKPYQKYDKPIGPQQK